MDSDFHLPKELRDDYERLMENDATLTEYAPDSLSTKKLMKLLLSQDNIGRNIGGDMIDRGDIVNFVMQSICKSLTVNTTLTKLDLASILNFDSHT
jgi:hypothetical protein